MSVEVFTKSGRNITDTLHTSCRDDAWKVMRRFSKNGNNADARAVARQILSTWPELETDGELRALCAE